MNSPTKPVKWLHVAAGAALLASFFLPWVKWKEVTVAGYAMPAGKFFSVSSAQFGLDNPFPQFAFSFYVFWLIPVLALVSVALTLQNRNGSLAAFVTGALSLSLLTVYYLFSGTLVDLGVGQSASGMLQAGAYIQALASVVFIASTLPVAQWLKKITWLVIGPVFAFVAYKYGERFVMNETFRHTAEVKADYTVKAQDLIAEFLANDTLANKKYREKILVVNGLATKVERLSDSTTTIQLADSSGSYVAFGFDKDQLDKLKNLRDGDPVSIKGSCSGSFYSEILGTTVINFKRSTLNQ